MILPLSVDRQTHDHSLSDAVDLIRLAASRLLPDAQRAALGQFMTPGSIARLMASMLTETPTHVELLRTYGTGVWQTNLQAYLASVETLKQRYAQQREMQRLPFNGDRFLGPYHSGE